MSDALPDPLIPPDTPPVRERRIVLTAALSVAVHLAILAWLLVPRLQLPEAAEPPAINVELVPPPVVSSEEPPSSSAQPSSEQPSSEQPSSASAEGASSASPSSELAASEPASAAPSSEAPASSEPASSAADSSASAASSAAPSSAEPASASAQAAPRSRPIVIPVAPSEASSEAASSAQDTSSEDPSSAASEARSAEPSSAAGSDISALTASGVGAEDAIADAPADAAAVSPSTEPAPPIRGALHTAKRFYLDAILDAPAMARARDAIRKLPPEKRLTQTCNIEAVGQVGNAGRGFDPNALIADAFAQPVIDPATASVTVVNGAFRSNDKWYGIAYTCTLGKDLGSVKSFSYRIGGDVTTTLKSRVGG